MERRRYERTEIEPFEIVFEEMVAGGRTHLNKSITVEQVSEYGMRFSTNVDFEVDDIIIFRLPSVEAESLFSGRIAWKKIFGEQQFRYGLDLKSTWKLPVE